MSVRRAGLLGCLALLSLGAVQLSGATFTSNSGSFGSIGAAADLTPPTVSVDASALIVSGTVALTATASDRESSVTSVQLEVRPAGSTTWTVLCSDSTAPYSCAWTTTAGADGTYDVRAIATDLQGNVGTSVVVQRTVDNLGPAVSVDLSSLPGYLRGTVTIPVTASDAGSGITSVRLQTSGNGTSWSDACTDTTAPYSCPVTTSGSGDLFLRAIAVDGVGNATTSAVVIASVDNSPPTVSTTSPGTTLSGTVTVSASAADADSGIASVLVEYRASSTSPWVALCTDTTSPYSCRFDTTLVADGTTYAFRSTATNDAGGVTTSATTVTSTVDNRLASVSVEDPGQYLRGTVPLVANANAPGGVQSVAIQFAPTGTTTWTTVCTDTTSPYGCSWDTTKVAGGTYDLRAVLTPVSGPVLASALVTGRIVDNAPLRGDDVQGANGGVLGRVDPGDVLTLTYSGQVNLDSIVSGWTGAARTVGVRLRDGTATGGLGGEDVLDLITAPGSTTAVNVGSINTRGQYIKGQAMVFSATMTAETVTVNGQLATRVVIRIDTLTTADNSRLARNARTMSWTPSAAARSLSGSAASTAPVDELGALDRDF